MKVSKKRLPKRGNPVAFLLILLLLLISSSFMAFGPVKEKKLGVTAGTDKHIVFPIPAIQISRNPKLKQNTGYDID